MTQPIFKHLDGQNVAELLNFKINPVTTDPATPVVGVPWFNITTGKAKYYDGTAVRVIAHLGDLAALGRYRGQWDASTGFPTAAASTVLPGDPIKAGDHWRISVGGNIANLIGVDLVAAGDLIFADADGANTAAQFYAVQANADLRITTVRDTVALATLAANTATNVTPTLLTGGKIANYMILDSTGKDITFSLDVTVDQVTPKLVVTSLVALSNLSISFVGTTA
ncbi:MAG: hypothetical protein ACRC8K_03375 [Waterburya sp.]